MTTRDIIAAVPGPRTPKRPAVARVLLRLPIAVHREVARSAARAGMSFNEWCVRRLAEPVSPSGAGSASGPVVGRALALFGETLTGVIALGSWVTGRAAAASDVDVLVVLDPRVPLTRDLYRDWDRDPLQVDGRVVDAHFTHLPDPARAPSALWCEAAVDGLIWYDRTGGVARQLAEVRGAIADGRVVRAVLHGHNYWKGVA